MQTTITQKSNHAKRSMEIAMRCEVSDHLPATQTVEF